MKKIEFCIAAIAAFAFGAFAEDIMAVENIGENPQPVPLGDLQPTIGEKVTVYRLQLYQNADGSEAACVVGVDGVRRPVVLVDPAEYKMLTERLDAVWQSFHSTPEGRRKLHGKARTVIDEAKREKVEVYADGYRHVETLSQKRRIGAAAVKVGGTASGEPPKPGNVSERQWQMRQRLSVLKKKPAREVTVEHDATTGKDTVK